MIEIILSGFLFLLIIVILNLASEGFGYEIFSDLDAETKLEKISDNPKKFKISFVLILIEHASIISLAAMLFIAFSQYDIMLAVVWTISRTIEGLIQIYYKKDYWQLLSIAKKYSSGAEKEELIDLGRNILKAKNTIFTFAQILFSIGTLAYSFLFATYSAGVPDFIGWLGVVSSILYGLGSGIKLAKTNFKALWSLGGLLIFIFELTLGGWLVVSPFF